MLLYHFQVKEQCIGPLTPHLEQLELDAVRRVGLEERAVGREAGDLLLGDVPAERVELAHELCDKVDREPVDADVRGARTARPGVEGE